jgi:drug/metabolite transporter (DMT)-like permease
MDYRSAARQLSSSAPGLLVITGALLGATPPLGKLATQHGILPTTWAFVISFGAGGILLCVLLWRAGGIRLTAAKLRYFAITATISYAIPNVLMFSVIPHVGAGYASIMFTLSPIITVMLSILLGVRRPNPLGIFGIVVGFVGAVIVASTRGQAGQPAAILWVALGLLIPVSLAAGNIYRTSSWPDDTTPLELAAGSHLAAATILLAAIIVLNEVTLLARLADVPWLVVMQLATATAMFVFFFRLQLVGGPVYLSQIGYVGAAVGLLVGISLLGERYALSTWIGAVLIAAGVIITTRARQDDR